MKKKILIVNANYYNDISTGLLSSAKRLIPKNFVYKIIKPRCFWNTCYYFKKYKNLTLL